MFCSPDYNTLCPDTIMNNIPRRPRDTHLKEFIYNTSSLQNCSKYMANQMKCEFKAAFALNFSEMLSQEELSLGCTMPGGPNTVQPLGEKTLL